MATRTGSRNYRKRKTTKSSGPIASLLKITKDFFSDSPTTQLLGKDSKFKVGGDSKGAKFTPAATAQRKKNMRIAGQKMLKSPEFQKVASESAEGVMDIGGIGTIRKGARGVDVATQLIKGTKKKTKVVHPKAKELTKSIKKGYRKKVDKAIDEANKREEDWRGWNAKSPEAQEALSEIGSVHGRPSKKRMKELGDIVNEDIRRMDDEVAVKNREAPVPMNLYESTSKGSSVDEDSWKRKIVKQRAKTKKSKIIGKDAKEFVYPAGMEGNPEARHRNIFAVPEFSYVPKGTGGSGLGEAVDEFTNIAKTKTGTYKEPRWKGDPEATSIPTGKIMQNPKLEKYYMTEERAEAVAANPPAARIQQDMEAFSRRASKNTKLFKETKKAKESLKIVKKATPKELSAATARKDPADAFPIKMKRGEYSTARYNLSLKSRVPGIPDKPFNAKENRKLRREQEAIDYLKMSKPKRRKAWKEQKELAKIMPF